MNLTEQQNKALCLRDKNLLVSASAGSGKTFVMVKRIIEHIKDGAHLNQMLIITFTKAAASDMREKIEKALSELAETNPEYMREIRSLPSAKIGTIDSWCQNLLKKYFYIADFDADFELLSSAESRIMAESAIDSLIDKYVDDPDFYSLYDSFVSNRRDKAFKTFMIEFLGFAYTQKDPELWLDSCAGKYDSAFAENVVRANIDKTQKSLLSEIEKLKEESSLVGYVKMAEYCSTLESALYSQFKLPPFKKNADFSELNDRKDSVCKKIKSLQTYIESIRDFQPLQEVKAQVKAAAVFAKELARVLFEEKKRKAVADYSDIEHLAYKILNNPDARSEILMSSKYVFVDEYQDVNPLQDALIEKAVGEKLYIVGDVKQSIYAFRMSDPEIFLDKYNNPDKYGIDEVVEFRDNFRSSNCVIDFCNKIFYRIMTVDLGGVDYKKAALTAGLGYDGGEVRVYAMNKLKQEKLPAEGIYSVKNAEAVRSESEIGIIYAIADEIENLLFYGDKQGNKVEPRDIAVLFRSSSPVIRELYDELRKRDINVFLREKNYFGSAPEVCVLQNFLKLLAYEKDEIALTSVLLSPIVGLDERELYTVSRNSEKSFYENLVAYAAENNNGISDKIKKVFAFTDKYGEFSRFMTVGELLSAFIAETQYVAVLLAAENGAFKAETVVKYIDYVAGLKAASSLSEYLAYIDSGNEQFESDAPRDALKIMTVHVSKGLEFPYVFLIESQKKFNMTDSYSRYIFDRDFGLCLKTVANGEIIPNMMSEAAKILKTQKTKEEEMRLLYVALTRAEKSLYIYSSKIPDEEITPENAVCFFDWIYPAAKDKLEYLLSDDYDGERIMSGKHFGGHDETLTEVIKKRINEKIFRNNVKIKTTVTGLSAEEGMSMTEKMPDDDRFGNDDAVKKRGTAYHAVMEKIDFFAPFEDEKNRLQDMFTPDIVPSEIRNAQIVVKNLMESFGGKVYREQSFVSANDNGTLIQGVIDLMLINGNNAIILDYKLTGEKNLLKETYIKQLNYYADAVEKILNVRVTDMFLYSFTGKVLKSVERNAKFT